MADKLQKPKKDISKLSKPKKCISKEEAKELHDNWCNDREGHLKKNLGFTDTREFWWSLEELEEYLAYVKKESKKQGIHDPGIRVYLGAHSKKQCKKDKGYSTLFLSPTGSEPRASGKDGGSRENNYRIAAFNGAGAGDPPKDY